MGRKVIAMILAGAGLSLGLTGTATAAPSGGAVAPKAVWYSVGTFTNADDCHTVGQAYVAVGRAIAYACEERYGPPRPWLLRVLD